MKILRNGWSGLLRPERDSSTDADLLGRFVAARDEGAFASMVERHGPMVLSVCRRRLGNGPDADDAFQAAFFALARDAGRIGKRESLAGWLHRVAFLTALKLNGRLHRRKTESLANEPVAPMPPETDAELKAAIDEELAALPDKFRSAAVLCWIEGLSHAEAGERLGIPKGTVDSRLSTAKERLRSRLLRRGIAAAALLGMENLLNTGAANAAGRVNTLLNRLVPAALQYAGGAAMPEFQTLSQLADGVQTVTTSKLKWLAAALIVSGLLGGAGVGVYTVSAQEGKPTEAKKPEKPKAPEKATAGEAVLENEPGFKDADDVHKALQRKLPEIPVKDKDFGDALKMFHANTGLTVRYDYPAFARKVKSGTIPSGPNFENAEKTKMLSDSAPGSTAGEVLKDLLAQLYLNNRNIADAEMPALSYRIKGNVVLIIPEHSPSNVPVEQQMPEAYFGEPVTARYKKMPISKVLEDLQERTGANIAAKFLEKAGEKEITVNFNDVRLLTALQILGEMVEMKAVVIDNVYFLTDPAKAVELEREMKARGNGAVGQQ